MFIKCFFKAKKTKSCFISNFQYLTEKTFSIWFSRTCLFCPFKVMCCTNRNYSGSLSCRITSLEKFGSEDVAWYHMNYIKWPFDPQPLPARVFIVQFLSIQFCFMLLFFVLNVLFGPFNGKIIEKTNNNS